MDLVPNGDFLFMWASHQDLLALAESIHSAFRTQAVNMCWILYHFELGSWSLQKAYSKRRCKRGKAWEEFAILHFMMKAHGSAEGLPFACMKSHSQVWALVKGRWTNYSEWGVSPEWLVKTFIGSLIPAVLIPALACMCMHSYACACPTTCHL